MPNNHPAHIIELANAIGSAAIGARRGPPEAKS